MFDLLRLLLRHVAQFYRKMTLCLSLSRAIPTSVGADGSPFHMITIVLVQVCLPFADFVTRLRHADIYPCVFSLLFRWGWSRKFGRRGCCSLISPRHSSKKHYCQNIARTKQASKRYVLYAAGQKKYVTVGSGRYQGSYKRQHGYLDCHKCRTLR